MTVSIGGGAEVPDGLYSAWSDGRVKLMVDPTEASGHVLMLVDVQDEGAMWVSTLELLRELGSRRERVLTLLWKPRDGQE